MPGTGCGVVSTTIALCLALSLCSDSVDPRFATTRPRRSPKSGFAGKERLDQGDFDADIILEDLRGLKIVSTESDRLGSTAVIERRGWELLNLAHQQRRFVVYYRAVV